MSDTTNNLGFHHSSEALKLGKNFNTLGSFWTAQMSTAGRKHAKALSSVALYTPTIASVQNVKNNLTNDADNLFAVNRTFTIQESGLTSDSAVYIGFTLGVDLTKIYTNPNPALTQVTPIPQILYSGVDFYQDFVNGQIVFNNVIDVTVYFHDGTFRYSGKYNKNSYYGQSFYNLLTGAAYAGVGQNSSLIANYVNGKYQSPKDFELMLNAALCLDATYGHHISDFLYRNTDTNGVFVYEDAITHDTYSVNVGFEPGDDTNFYKGGDFINSYTRVPENWIPVPLVSVYYKTNKNDYWWRNNAAVMPDRIAYSAIAPHAIGMPNDPNHPGVDCNTFVFDTSVLTSAFDTPYFDYLGEEFNLIKTNAWNSYTNTSPTNSTALDYMLTMMVPNALIVVLAPNSAWLKYYDQYKNNEYFYSMFGVDDSSTANTERAFKLKSYIISLVKQYSPLGYLPIIMDSDIVDGHVKITTEYKPLYKTTTLT